VVSLGDDVGTLLAGRVARAVAPDVAILPWPGLVAAASDRVQELPNLTPKGVSSSWRALASPGGGPPRGVWYKATHKSMVWYCPDVFRQYGVEPPADWASWLEIRDTFAAGGLAPLSIGAADGWVLTDWFENVLWGLDDVTYELLARGERSWDHSSVAQTLKLLADLWTPAGLLGGPGRSLLVQFEDSVLDVAQRGRAAMVLGADFVLPVVHRLAPEAPPMDWFPVPRPRGGVPPVVVGGDLAVLLAGAGEGGLPLVEWLARREAARDWAAAGGFISLRSDVAGYPAQYKKELLDQVRTGGPDGFGFDLSDRLAGSSLSGGDGRGLWRLLQRFLAELGRGGETGRVVEDTVAQLVAAAGARR
jgi:alpha-glucoside transport system substrate-binding protein